MKKSVLALAVLGAFTGVVSAQSSVTMFGVVDLNGTERRQCRGGAPGQQAHLACPGADVVGQAIVELAVEHDPVAHHPDGHRGDDGQALVGRGAGRFSIVAPTGTSPAAALFLTGNGDSAP